MVEEHRGDFTNMRTFIALPINSFENHVFQKPEQFEVIKSAIIKTLSNGTLCVINENAQFQIDGNFDNQSQSSLQGSQVITSESRNVTSEPSSQVPAQKVSSSVFKCPKCKEVFDKIALYRKHMMWHRNIKKYKCTKCSASYNLETNFVIHMAMHEEGKPTCPICKISFQRLASLKSHLMMHQVEEIYTCEECNAEFEREEELAKHLQSHSSNTMENNNLICSYCNVQFDDSKAYKEHISRHIKVKKLVFSGKKPRKTQTRKQYPHVCNVCLKSFSRVSLLERHLRVHSGEKPFICPHCNKGFNQKGALQIHLNSHTGVKPFQCTLCSAKFNQKCNLRVHVEKTHTAPIPGVKPYKCSHCACIFKKIASLNVHVTKVHATEEDTGNITSVISRLKELEEQTASNKSIDKKINGEEIKRVDNEGTNTSYVKLAESFLDGTVRTYLVMQKKIDDVRWYICSYCNKEFKKPSDLIRHTRMHTREKPFSCKQCGACFTLKSTLFCHIKTHSINKNYVCKICMKKFSSLHSVNFHLRKHLEKQIQTFKCTVCSKTFTSLQKLTQHSQIHIQSTKHPIIIKHCEGNIKHFQCQICNVTFSKLANFNRHMLIHTGEKKFKCDKCTKSYYTAQALKEHSFYHSGVKNYACKFCEKKYATSSLLKRHLISHNINKPYICVFCNKGFKSMSLCRKHLNIHKKDANFSTTVNKIVFHELNSTNAIKVDLCQPQTSDMKENTQIDMFIKNECTSIQEQNEANLFIEGSCGNEVQLDQIINNVNKTAEQDSNLVHTIFINYQDVQMTNNLNSQNTDTMFFNPLDDLQVGNVLNVDTLNDNFNSQNVEIYDTSQIFNVVNQTVNDKNDKISNQLDLATSINDSSHENNVPVYTHSELNLFNLDPVLEAGNLANDNLDLPNVNVNEQLSNTGITEENNKTKDIYSCDKCTKVFNNRSLFNKHNKTHKIVKSNGGNFHHCSFCSKCFKKQSDLVRHIRTHTGEKPFACDKCEKKFSLKSTLMSHQRTHNPVSHKHYNCVVCNSFFTSKSSLKVHLSVHTGDKAHECRFCPTKFRTAAHRKSHEVNHHKNPSKNKKKNKVTNLLASVAMDALNQEQPLVTLPNDDQNIGGDLGNILVVQDNLTLPEDQMNLLQDNVTALTESNRLEPIVVQQLHPNVLLTDSFISPSLIQLDDRVVLNFKDNNVNSEKPRNFECEVCGKKYASKDVLRKHKKNHGVNKKFPCTKCDKGFDLEEDLEKHEKIHVGYRPYSCMYCTNSFSREHSLTTHVKRIHNLSVKDDCLLLYDLE